MIRGRHETTDFSPAYVVASGAILVIVGISLYVLVWGFFNYFAKPSAPVAQALEPASPRLQVDPHRDLERVRARELELLNSYGWLNRNDRIVRVPINRAMDLVVERGLPEFKESGATRKETK